jgi:hypothetical protein
MQSSNQTMSPYLPISTPEDIRKLQMEMHQLQNQQFLLATAGLTVFGFAAWAAPHAANNGASPHILEQICAASGVSLLFLLGVLFAWSLTLHSLIVTISSYLELRGASEWEGDYRAFHWSTLRPRPRSKTRWVSTIYFVLGLLIPGYFAAAIIVAGLQFSTLSAVAVFGASGLYLIAVLLSITLLPRDERKIREKWSKILSERHPITIEREPKVTSTSRAGIA